MADIFATMELVAEFNETIRRIVVTVADPAAARQKIEDALTDARSKADKIGTTLIVDLDKHTYPLLDKPIKARIKRLRRMGHTIPKTH